jgi:hypothetical protein
VVIYFIEFYQRQCRHYRFDNRDLVELLQHPLVLHHHLGHLLPILSLYIFFVKYTGGYWTWIYFLV